MAREVINVPSKRLVPPRMARQAMGKTPLGAAHIKVQPGSEDNVPEPADGDRPAIWQMENRDVNASIHAPHRTRSIPLPDTTITRILWRTWWR